MTRDPQSFATAMSTDVNAQAHSKWRFRLPSRLASGAILVALILSIPILSVVLSVFQTGEGNWSHLASTVLPRYIENSLILMVGVAVGVTILGVGTAWLVVMCRFPGKRLFEWALILPISIPAYVVAYAYTDVLQSSGPIQSMIRDLTGLRFGQYWFPNVRSIEGAIVIFTAVLYPYVYLLTRAAFLEQSICVLDVARTLGQTSWGAFRKVAIPLARPAIIAGVSLALMETLADFGTVSHFGIQTFTTGIYRTWASMGDGVAAAQLSSLLLTFVFVLLVMERLSRRRARYYQTSFRYQAISTYRLTGLRALAASAFCAVPLILGFVGPISMLIYMHVTAGHDLLTPRYIALIQNSVIMSGTTAVLAVSIALFLAFVARVENSRTSHMANRVAAVGYAIPGTMVAIGLLVPLAAFDTTLNHISEQFFGVSLGLVLSGSLAALVLGYLVRFMAVSLNTVEASLAKVTPSMEGAARTLGQGRLSTVKRVHSPIMAGGLFTAALIVFVDVMKELPATLILRPFNFDTLAIQAYNLARDERLTQAATPSLVIIAVGILPLLILNRAIMRSRPGSGGGPTTAGQG